MATACASLEVRSLRLDVHVSRSGIMVATPEEDRQLAVCRVVAEKTNEHVSERLRLPDVLMVKAKFIIFAF